MEILRDKIEFKLDRKKFEATKSGYTLPPGVYEIMKIAMLT